jgi:hypothetical protein
MTRDAIKGWDSTKALLRGDARKREQMSCDYPGCHGGFVITNEKVGGATLSSMDRCPKCNGERK